MKAIITKTLPATNTKPARIKASAEGVASVIYSRDSLGMEENLSTHQLAARQFCRHRGWDGSLASGGLPDGSWVHCFVDSRNITEI